MSIVSVEPVYTFELAPGQEVVTLDNSNITGTLTTFSDGTKKETAIPKKKVDAKKLPKKIVWYPASHFY